jgi:rare lipoprotein A
MMNYQLRRLVTVTLLSSALSVGLGGRIMAAKTPARPDQNQTNQTSAAVTSKSQHQIPESESPYGTAFKSQPQMNLIAHTQGKASWYGPGFQGQLTANGERFNTWAHTAAHRSLPFGTKVRVTNLRNGEAVVVRINDRGPYVGGRVIDLSKAAAQEIGMVHSGTAPVQLEILGR